MENSPRALFCILAILACIYDYLFIYIIYIYLFIYSLFIYIYVYIYIYTLSNKIPCKRCSAVQVHACRHVFFLSMTGLVQHGFAAGKFCGPACMRILRASGYPCFSNRHPLMAGLRPADLARNISCPIGRKFYSGHAHSHAG